MRKSPQSPYETLGGNFLYSIRSFITNHDKYLIIALFMCFLPLPVGGLIAFVISMIALPFYKKGLFQYNERNLILVLIPLSLVNIILTSFLLFNIYDNSNVLLFSFINLLVEFFFPSAGPTGSTI